MSTLQLHLHEGTFRAFGSKCRVVCDVPGSVDFAVDRLGDLESRWSRFRYESEVGEVNRHAGEWCEVSVATEKLFAAAVDAVELTNGLVNPLMLRQLEHLGYVESHEHLELCSGPTSSQGQPTMPASSTAIDVDGGAVRIPPHCGFDPGGIGKGLATDLVVDDLLDQGARWAMVSLGGDVRFAGSLLAKAMPHVLVADPRIPDAVLGATRVAGGALATSSTTTRRWTEGGNVHHHLLDPTTGLPTQSPRIAASVYAATGWLADVVAKALVIDPSLGADDLDPWGAEGIAFTSSEVIDLGLPVEAFPESVAS